MPESINRNRYSLYSWIVKIVSITLLSLLLGACSGGSGTDSGGETEISGTVQLGFISDGQVKLFELSDLSNEISVTRTSSSNMVAEAGRFTFKDISINEDTFYLLEITGGNDIDPNDDGIIEVDQKIALQGTVYALAKGSDLISGDTRVNALTDIAYQKIKDGLTSLSNEQISAFLKKNADEFVYDIDGDGVINNKDILLFNPIEHSRKVKQSYQDILDVYIAKVHSGAVEEKKLSSLMYVNPPRIVIGSGSLQEIPFNLNANIENSPLNLTVKWFLNSVEKSAIDESITDDGIYHVEAWFYKGTTLLKVIEKSVIATHKVEIATIEADVSKDNEIKVTTSDAGSSSLAGTQVFIPQGALSENTKITIKKSSINSIPNSKGSSISDVIVMEPAGLIFEKPIQIRIPYDEIVDIENVSIRVARYSEEAGLDYIKPLFLDTTSHEVVFEISHFTSFQAEIDWVGKSADQKFVDKLNTEFSLNKSIQDWDPILNTYIDITAKNLTVYDYLLTYFENKKLYEIIENSNSNQLWGAIALNSLYPNSSEVGRNFDMWDGVKDGFEVIDQLQGISSGLVKIDKGEIYTGLLNALGLPTDAGGFNPHKYKPTDIATNIVKSFNNAKNHVLVQHIINNSNASNAESADAKCTLDDDAIGSYIDGMSDVQGIKWMTKSVCTRYQAYKMMLDNPNITDDLNNEITPKFEATAVLNSVINKIIAEETEAKYTKHPVSEFVDKHYVQNPLLINSEAYKNISIPIKIATKGYEGLGDFVPRFELTNIETNEVYIEIAIGKASNAGFQKLDSINGIYTATINFKAPGKNTNYSLKYEIDKYFTLIDDNGSWSVNVAITLPPIKAKITGVSIVDKLLENGDYQFHLEAQFDSGNYPVVIECSLSLDCTKDIIISSSDFDLPKLNDLSVSIRPTDEVSQYFVEPNYATNIDMQFRISEVEAEGYLDLTSPFIGDGPGTIDRPDNFAPIANITIFDGVTPLSNVLVGVEASLMLDATKSSDSDGAIVSYEWTEGSMLLSKESVFTKTDFSAGEHTISLTVKDSDGATATDTVTVRVFEFKQTPIDTAEETTKIVYQNGSIFLKLVNKMAPSVDIPYTISIRDRANFGSNISEDLTLTPEGGVKTIDITSFVNQHNLKYKVIEVEAWSRASVKTLDKLRFFIDYADLYKEATIAKLVLNDTIKNKGSENADNVWPNKEGEEENNALDTITHRIIDFDKIVNKKVNFGNEFWEKSDYATQTKKNFIEASDTRKPLLLIHGWQGNIGQTEPAKMLMYDNNEFKYWHNVISYYLATPELHNNYKLYTYHYPSYKHITFNARMLKKLLLDELPNNSLLAKGVNNSGVVIVGHSMGGLVARSLIEEHTALGTNAERLIKLITLDTPHHGSPSTLTSIIRVDLVNGLAKDLETPGAVDLLWDNYNQHFTCNPLGTVVCEHLLSATIQTKDGDSRYRKLLDEGRFDDHYSSLNSTSGFGLGSGELNPWLTNLNGVFAEKSTQYTDKYVFYVAFTSPNGAEWVGLYNTLKNDTFGMHANTDLINFHGYASGGAEPVSSAFLSKSLTVDEATRFSPRTGDITSSSLKPEKYIDINNLGHANNYNIPYRVFWDYNHERIMNGAYFDIGDWDTFIDKGEQEKVNTCELTVFKSINNAGSCNTARGQYVDLALEYLYQGTNSLTITDQTNSESNNPLKTEPVFLILQRDLLDSLSHTSPVANAGVDKNVIEGEPVLFDASLSAADGGIKNYEWSKEGTILALTSSFTKNNDLSIGEHTFTLRITDFFNETSRDTIKVIVSEAGVDTEAPTIKLNGNSVIIINQGADYVEQGATVTDNIDANKEAERSGTVNTNIVDIYTITYSGIDSSGNVATAVTRKVDVRLATGVDTTAPKITLNGPATITINQGEIYTEQGATVTDNIDADKEAKKSGTVDTSTVKNYILTYSATDSAGNTAEPVTRTVIVQAVINKFVSYHVESIPADSCDTYTQTGCEAIIDRGTTLTHSWSFTNQGNVDLNSLSVGIIDAPSGVTGAVMQDKSAIKPGEAVTYSVNLAFPADIMAGTYQALYSLKDAEGEILYENNNPARFWYKFKVLPANEIQGYIYPSKTNLQINEELLISLVLNSGNPDYSITVDWGDSTNDSYTETGGTSLAHQYAAEGNYSIIVNVSDSAGKSASYPLTVIVKDAISMTTQWDVFGADLSTNTTANNLPVMADSITGSYKTSWVPSAGGTEYFINYRLPVPKGLITFDKGVRIVMSSSEVPLKSYDRAVSLITSDNKTYTSAILAGTNGYTRLIDHALNEDTKTFKSTLGDEEIGVTSSAERTYIVKIKDDIYETLKVGEIITGDVVHLPLDQESYLFTGNSLEMINIAFKGNGKLNNIYIEYDLNDDGIYDPTNERVVLNTADFKVDWSVFGSTTVTPPITTSGTSKLNDTGITWSGNYPSGNNTTCVGTEVDKQDCSHGRDALGGSLSKVGSGAVGFDFTKLDSNGNAMAATGDGVWSCVKDNHTGLIWEVKTTDGGIHDTNNTYRWGGLTAQGRDHASKEGIYYDDWNTLVEGSNTNNFCGYNGGWRVPNRDELRSIVNLGSNNINIYHDYFPHMSYWYWSAVPKADDSTLAFGVYISFGGDDTGHRDYAGDGHVRLVRSM